MRRWIISGIAVAACAAVGVGVGAVAGADNPSRDIRGRLTGFEEVPALSTPGDGEFSASINKAGDTISWTLTFGDLESDVTQAHIHFENATNSGPVVVFLCSNLNNSPVPTQLCPAGGGTINGEIHAADVIGVAGGAAQGLGSGELGELIDAIRAGATYVNVHSTTRPAGEIRAQLDASHGHD